MTKRMIITAASSGMRNFYFFACFELVRPPASDVSVGAVLDFLSFLFWGESFDAAASSPFFYAAYVSSLLYVKYTLTTFEAFLKISEIAMAAIMHATGAKTSINLIMTQEKYVANTP